MSVHKMFLLKKNHHVRIVFLYNPQVSKGFVNRLNTATTFKYACYVIWQMMKIRSLKDRDKHPSRVTYEGKCSCRDATLMKQKET